MKKPTRSRTHSLRPFVQHLSEVASGLPSKDDIAKAKAALNDIVSFLEDVRNSLDALPTAEGSLPVADSIRVFDTLLDAAQASPALSLALGLSPKSERRAATPRSTAQDIRRGVDLASELAGLTVDQVRDRLLNDSSIRLTDLRALAAHLHVRYQSKSTRESLAQTLTMRIANARGYDALSNTSVEPS